MPNSAFLSVVMPCPSPLFQRGPHTGKEPAQEMCATDSKARGQNHLCPLELKVQLRDMGLQICSSPDSISICFGQVFPTYISFFPSGIGTYILCPYILEECKLFKNFYRRLQLTDCLESQRDFGLLNSVQTIKETMGTCED